MAVPTLNNAEVVLLDQEAVKSSELNIIIRDNRAQKICW